MRDPRHPLHHRPPLLICGHHATLVSRNLAFERARAAELLPGLDMLALQHCDQIIAIDRLTPPHAELRECLVGAEP